MYGKNHSLETLAKMRKQVFVYSFDSVSNERIFFKSFNSCLDAAKELNTSKSTISRYLDKGKLLQDKWFLSTSVLSPANSRPPTNSKED